MPYRGVLIRKRNVKMSWAQSMEVRGEMSRERIYQEYLENRKIAKAILEICKIHVSYFGSGLLFSCKACMGISWKSKEYKISPAPIVEELFTQCNQISCLWPFLAVILEALFHQSATNGSSICGVCQGNNKAGRSPVCSIKIKKSVTSSMFLMQ